MATTMRKVNEALAPFGVEVVKGNGYFYFADAGEAYVAHKIPSVYDMRLSCMSQEQWVDHVRVALA
jgi:hypothetical protein